MWHVGRVSHSSLRPDGGEPVSSTAKKAETKTFVLENGRGKFVATSKPRALEAAEVPGIVQEYRNAGRAAIGAGFDGAKINAANGDLIDQFLRSGVNDRKDQYDGSIENRARFLLEVVTAVTREIGAGRTAIRLSPVTSSDDASDRSRYLPMSSRASRNSTCPMFMSWSDGPSRPARLPTGRYPI